MEGHVCPSLGPADTEQKRALFAAVLKHGMTLHRLHANSRAVRLTGPGGVHIVAESLAWIKTKDVEGYGHR